MKAISYCPDSTWGYLFDFILKKKNKEKLTKLSQVIKQVRKKMLWNFFSTSRES